MIKKKNMKKICFALALPFAFLGAGFMGGSLPATDGASNNNKQDYINPISVYGSSFNDGISGEYSQSTPGWEVIILISTTLTTTFPKTHTRLMKMTEF